MNFLAAFLFGLGVVVIQVLSGGAGNPAFALPGYLLIVAGGAAAAVGGFRSSGGVSAGVVLLAAALFGYLCWRAGESPDDLAGQRVMGLILACGVLWFSFAGILTSTLSRWIFVGVLVLGSLGNLVVGVLQVTSDWESYALFFAAPDVRDVYVEKFDGRMLGTYLNPNHLAWVFNAAALFCLGIGVWARVKVWMRVLTIYFSACFALGTVLTGSRGGMIALGLAMAAFAVASLVAMATNPVHRRVWLSLSVVVGICVVVAGGYLAYSSSWQVQGRIDSLSKFSDVRSILNEYGWRQFQREPVLGSGPGMFLYAARALRRIQSDDAVYVHNDWLQVAVEYGWVGFSLLILLVGVLLWQGVAMFSRRVRMSFDSLGTVSETGAAFLLGAWATLIAFSVHSLFDFNMYTPANALLAAGVAGMLGSVSIAGGNRWEEISSGLGRGLCIALAFVGALLLGFWLRQQAEPEYRLHRARQALERENHGKAIEEAKKGLAGAPTHPELLFTLGTALERPNIFEEDRPSLVIDEESQPEGDPLMDESLSAYRGALEARPFERQYLIAVGETLAGLGQREEALQMLRRAIMFEPNHAYAFQAVGDFYEEAGDLDSAFKWYRAGASLPGPEYSRVQLQYVTRKIERREVDRAAEGNVEDNPSGSPGVVP